MKINEMIQFFGPFTMTNLCKKMATKPCKSALVRNFGGLFGAGH